MDKNVRVFTDKVMPYIEIDTPAGILCACVGGDPKGHPEFFMYIRREDGAEIDLVCVGVDVETQNVKAYLYGDTTTDTPTDDYFWTKEEIERDLDSINLRGNEMTHDNFAECVWCDADLDELDGIEYLSADEREEFKKSVRSSLEDTMCEIGWEILQNALDMWRQ